MEGKHIESGPRTRARCSSGRILEVSDFATRSFARPVREVGQVKINSPRTLVFKLFVVARTVPFREHTNDNGMRNLELFLETKPATGTPLIQAFKPPFLVS